MARPRIVDVDYFQFRKALQRAIDNGQRISESDKQRWLSWVRQHGVREAAFRSFAAGKYEGLEPVIIDADGAWRGYYLFSTQEEACLKWEHNSE